MVVITNHAEERFRQRTGLSKKIVDKMAVKALHEGLTHKDVRGSLNRFVDHLYLSHRKCNNIRIYNKKVFMFKGNCLITVLDLPSKYHKVVDKLNRERKFANEM